MILYTDNQADIANVSAVDPIINYPPSNVQDSRLSRIYKGAGKIDFDISGTGALKNISQAYTNLVQDPTDLTTGNWTLISGSTAASSTETFQGLPMSKIGSTTPTVGPIATQSGLVVSNGVNNSAGIVIRNENYLAGDVINVFLIIAAPFTVIGQVTIDLVNKTVILTTGDSIKYNFVDDNTVEISFITDLTVGTSIEFRIDPLGVGDSTKFIYITACQLVDNTTTFLPFIDGSKTADVIDETFTMPDRFIERIKYTPNFSYDTSISHRIVEWLIDGTHLLRLLYNSGFDLFQLQWQDGGTLRVLTSNVFDSSNLNQELDFVISVDLISGGANDSRFIVFDSDGVKLVEDTTWNGVPDIKSSTFPTKSIGHEGGSLQADSSYQSDIVYEGLLVGTVTSSDDVTELLKDKKVLLDITYQQKLTATDLLLANTTINDGDTITLRANDVDSYGPGTPLDETVIWSKDIIKHNFLKSTYQFWRLSVNSSNDIEIGRIFLGESYDTPGMSPTVTNDLISTSAKSISIGGSSYQDTRYKYHKINTTWPAVTHAEKAEIFDIFESIDIGTPFFITFDEDCSDLGTLYVTFDTDNLRATLLNNKNYYTIGLTVREEK